MGEFVCLFFFLVNKDVLNGSNKYYSGSQNRATILTVNKRGTSFHFPENSSFRFLNPSKQYEYNFHSRSISTNFALYEKSSSKVEDVVKNLKEVEKEKEKSAAATAATETPKTPETTTISTSAPQQQQQVASVATESAVSSQVVKKSLGQKIWAELVHYYHGFRLLFIDINVCRKYLWQILKGEQLSRREHRLLIRTTSDLFRLLPFSVFIIVPFMELLLPLAIKLFPGMLPSTFQSASDRDNKLKQNLKMKIEMAKFLQQTLDDMTVQSKDHRSQSAKEFSEFFKRLRTSGGFATNEEIMKFSKLFEDEITLDSLNRAQLLALCRVLEANTIGTSNLLRFQLRLKIRSLIADDRMIQKEGINSLNYQELQAACRARGMRAYGMTEERLRDQLMEWIDLSLNAKVPPSLLLLSRAMMIPEDVDVSEKLKVTLASLPDTVATQAKAAIGEREGKIDNKTKIEIIKEEQRKIQEEKEEEKEEILAKEQKKLQEKADILVDGAPIVTSDGIVAKTSEQISQMFMEQKAMDQEEKLFVENVKEKELSSEDLKVLEDALDNISKEKKHLIMEKEEIKEIKEEIAEYKEDVEELEQIVTKNKDEQVHVKESRAAKLLYKKVNSMINKLDTVLDDLEKKEKEIKVLIGEPVEITEAEDSAFEEEKKKKEELVRIDEMMSAIRKVSSENIIDIYLIEI